MSAPVRPADNPLLDTTTLPHSAPRFDAIRPEHFAPAFDWAIAEANQRIEAIKADPNPTFESVIEGLEAATKEVDRISHLYGNYMGVMRGPEMERDAESIARTLSAFGSDISLDDGLFAQVKAVYDARDGSDLAPDQRKLLEDTYKGFERSGALLGPEDKARMKDISAELSRLSTVFERNVLASKASFKHLVTDESQLAGLPDSAKKAAAEAAKKAGKDGFMFTLDAPSVGPVLQYAENRDLRETLWRASATSATLPPNDNRPVIQQIATLRHEKAQVLGFDTYADYVLADRMAGSVQAVKDTLGYLQEGAKPAADKDFEDLKAFVAAQKGPDPLKPWDVGFYVEKLRQQEFGFDSEALRPFLPFDQVAQGAFDVAGKLYGLKFEKTDQYPTYHEDVQVFEVKDAKSGDLMGLVYSDYFPRETKRPGAWMNNYINQAHDEDGRKIPVIGLHGNFTRPDAEGKSLLTLGEVTTFFHELGHGLHGLLSDVRYASQAGPQVKWDFVELPSQLMENWVKDKTVLDMFARHHETGDVIPEDLFAKLKKAETFRSGSAMMRQLDLANLDMTWHTTDPATITDVEAFEKQTRAPFATLAPEPGAMMSPAFGHIFSGGYAAGYYSYKWAEVLEADAFEAFEENGLFDDITAAKFRTLMAAGGSEQPMDLYRAFRGREPDPAALLRREGLLPGEAPVAANDAQGPASQAQAAAAGAGGGWTTSLAASEAAAKTPEQAAKAPVKGSSGPGPGR